MVLCSDYFKTLKYSSCMYDMGWLGSRVVSVLDWGTEGPGFKSQPRRCLVTVLGKLFTPFVPLHQAAKLVAALLRVAGVTAGLVESNGSLLPGLWLMSPAGWLPRTEISSGTLRSVIDCGLPLPFYVWHCSWCSVVMQWPVASWRSAVCASVLWWMVTTCMLDVK